MQGANKCAMSPKTVWSTVPEGFVETWIQYRVMDKIFFLLLDWIIPTVVSMLTPPPIRSPSSLPSTLFHIPWRWQIVSILNKNLPTSICCFDLTCKSMLPTDWSTATQTPYLNRSLWHSWFLVVVSMVNVPLNSTMPSLAGGSWLKQVKFCLAICPTNEIQGEHDKHGGAVIKNNPQKLAKVTSLFRWLNIRFNV